VERPAPAGVFVIHDYLCAVEHGTARAGSDAADVRWVAHLACLELSDADLDFYVQQFQHSGFRGGLNWYRNIDRNWELLAPYAGASVTASAVRLAVVIVMFISSSSVARPRSGCPACPNTRDTPPPMTPITSRHAATPLALFLITPSGLQSSAFPGLAPTEVD